MSRAEAAVGAGHGPRSSSAFLLALSTAQLQEQNGETQTVQVDGLRLVRNTR